MYTNLISYLRVNMARLHNIDQFVNALIGKQSMLTPRHIRNASTYSERKLKQVVHADIVISVL